jgi:hypothetical protein
MTFAGLRLQTADERRETAVRGAGSEATEYSPGCPLSAAVFHRGAQFHASNAQA